MSKLTKRERDFLRPAVRYGWQIECWPTRRPCWDGDSILPVKVGPVCESLIQKGYLERLNIVFPVIRPTQKAKDLRCWCAGGKIYNDDDEVIGRCEKCDGEGMKHDAQEEAKL